MWCLTISFVEDVDANNDSPIPTYPLAIGPKGINHRIVIRKIMEDLAKHRISTNPISTYNGVGHSPMSVTLDVFAYLGDQPERRGLNYLMLGKSTHHARWRFSCNMSLLIPIL